MKTRDAPSPIEQPDAQSRCEGETLDDLFAGAYGAMKRTARHYTRSAESTTAAELVHEAYLKLAASQPSFQDREHLCAVAALTMRRVAIDQARRHARNKRGGGRKRVPLRDFMRVTPPRSEDLMMLEDALRELAEWDQRAAQAVGLHYLEGYGVQETANKLEVSRRTVHRDLESGRNWLASQLKGPKGESPETTLPGA